MFVSTGSNYTHLANRHDLNLKLRNGFLCTQKNSIQMESKKKKKLRALPNNIVLAVR